MLGRAWREAGRLSRWQFCCAGAKGPHSPLRSHRAKSRHPSAVPADRCLDFARHERNLMCNQVHALKAPPCTSSTKPRFSSSPATAAPAPCRSGARNISNMAAPTAATARSEEHTSELQSLMRISYAVFCLKKKKERIDRKE